MKKSILSLVVVLITVMGLTSCGTTEVKPTTVKAKVKYTYPIVGSTLKIIEVDPMFEPGDTIVFAGIHYTIISIERPDDNNRPMKDYQIDLHMDTVWIYDNNRLVGSYITTWESQIDSILLKDNL